MHHLHQLSGNKPLHVQVDDFNLLLIQPITLRKIGQMIARISQSHNKNRKTSVYRFILGVENTISGESAVVGVEAPWSGGFQAPSIVGKLFQMACKLEANLELHQQSFDGEYVRFSGCSLGHFVSLVNSACEKLHKHADYVDVHEHDEEEESAD